MDFPKPGVEHQKLRRLTGAWAARIKYYGTPDRLPIESSCEYLARMDIGGYFLCREVNFGIQGYQGRGITGYDAFQRVYSGMWIDSASPIIYRTLGHFDDRGVYCETSEGPGVDGTLLRQRMTTEVIDTNQMLFRLYTVNASGEETLLLQIDHTRRRFVD